MSEQDKRYYTINFFNGILGKPEWNGKDYATITEAIARAKQAIAQESTPLDNLGGRSGIICIFHMTKEQYNQDNFPVPIVLWWKGVLITDSGNTFGTNTTKNDN